MRLINRVENWERVYEAFQQINFSAWDYDTVKESLLDYLKLYYPEDFNDYIESSEIVMVCELFSYVATLFAYRLDLNSNENILSIAQRKESVLRLAKFLSYSATRNIAGRGLVKINSVLTNEPIFDSKGAPLANRIIRWNDISNPNWKEQFTLVLESSLQQKIGSVLPSDRVQVNDVLFEVYGTKSSLRTPRIAYNINTSEASLPMELVPAVLNEFGPFERRPERNRDISILYLSDGLGDSSNNTGFFFLTKQGELNQLTAKFDGVLPNQTYEIGEEFINQTDVWLNNVNPDTGEVVSAAVGTGQVKGYWEQVDVVNGKSLIFSADTNKNRYEVETLDDDNVRIIFGDGKFANIPSGFFDIWYRTSETNDVVIPTSSIQNINSSLDYVGKDSKRYSLSFTFSLVSPIQNSAPTETLDHIKRTAPSVYYSQDRMVTGPDYNLYPLQDNSILKLRAINRTHAGDSKWIHWRDPREYYENVKIFGDDGVLYFKSDIKERLIDKSELPDNDFGSNIPLTNSLVLNFIQPLLSEEDLFILYVLGGVSPSETRTQFTTAEMTVIRQSLFSAIISNPTTVYLSYNSTTDVWSVSIVEPASWYISVTSRPDGNWLMSINSKQISFYSEEIKFWNSNNDRKIVSYDTFNANYDTITVLKPNTGVDGCSLDSNREFRVLKQDTIEVGENVGLYDIHQLHILPQDENSDGIPDDVDLSYIIGSGNYVYFFREDENTPWKFVPRSPFIELSYQQEMDDNTILVKRYKRERGVEGVNFLWMHRTPRYHLIDPSVTNIIDMFIISRGYYKEVRRWLVGNSTTVPQPETSFELSKNYGYLLANKMISDTVILHPGKIKPIIGKLSKDNLRAKIKVIRSEESTITSNKLKAEIVSLIDEFFSINLWEFGETFYFTELASYIHTKLPSDVDSVVLVPLDSRNAFGTLYQVLAGEDEIIQASITVDDVEIVESLTPKNLKQAL